MKMVKMVIRAIAAARPRRLVEGKKMQAAIRSSRMGMTRENASPQNDGNRRPRKTSLKLWCASSFEMPVYTKRKMMKVARHCTKPLLMLLLTGMGMLFFLYYKVEKETAVFLKRLEA